LTIDNEPKWRVGIDIGGTFTDIVAYNLSNGDTRIGKVPSRYEDPVGAIEEAIASLQLEDSSIEAVIHGTTRVTNAIVEGNLPDVALVATAGFEDTLEIARLSRAHLYRLDLLPKAPPLVPADRRFGIDERMDVSGNPIRKIQASDIVAIVDRVVEARVESVAVSFLHSYANGDHETKLGKAFEKRGLHVSLSHVINPEAREYERTSVTVLSAAITPIAVDYLKTIESETSIGHKLKLFHSAGGMATPDSIRAQPLAMAMSGPAAGVAASARLAQEIDCDRALTFDMGGTTTDVCLILDGKAEVADNRQIAERPIRMPMVAVESIGAGGGSIVKVGTGSIDVGPDSAGAEPGPACYGLGGTEATVTDVNVALGYVDVDRKLGGKISIDQDKAFEALAPLAKKLDMDIIDFALGATLITNATMARALRRVTVEKGIDGRTCTLIAFGGAAPMHAAGLAAAYGIQKVVVPRASSVFSANGCVFADTTYTHQKTLRMTSSEWIKDTFDQAVQHSEEIVLAPLKTEEKRSPSPTITHIGLIRYVGQSSLVEVPLEFPHNVEETGRIFRLKHKALYGFSTEEAYEIQSLRTTATLPSEIKNKDKLSHPSTTPEPVKHSSCWFDRSGPVHTPRYDRTDLGPGSQLSGPAIFEDANSTVVVPPKWHVTVDASNNLILEDKTK